MPIQQPVLTETHICKFFPSFTTAIRGSFTAGGFFTINLTFMKLKGLPLIIFIFSFYTLPSFAQEAADENKSSFKISLNYNSNLNYYGRTDSLKSSGVFPLAELWFTPNFYVNAAPVFVNNKVQSMEYAGSVASVGYLHTSTKWISNTYLLKPFYKEDSKLVQSALTAQAGSSITFLSKLINLTAGGDIKLSKQVDFGAMAGADHIFRIPASKNIVLVIDPSFYSYAGTQRFSNSYKRKTGGLFPKEQVVTETNQKFNILSYEASVPVIISKGKAQLITTPSYVMPQHLMNSSNNAAAAEKGEDTFYVTLGLKYSF